MMAICTCPAGLLSAVVFRVWKRAFIGGSSARRRRFGLALFSLLAALGQTSAARAFCFTGGVQEVGDLQAVIQMDPKAGLPDIERRLSTHPDAHMAAWLYATRANAYSALELDKEELSAARQGLALLGTRNDSAKLELLIQEANALEDDDAIAQAIDRIAAIQKSLPAGSIASVCATGAIGVLEMQIDRIKASTHHVIDAYRASLGSGFEGPRAALAFSLLTIMLRAEDLDAALSLNEEEIAYEQAHRQTYLLANALLARGMILNRQGHFTAALAAFTQSEKFDHAIGHEQGLAYVRRGTCDALLGLARLDEARAACLDARRLYGSALELTTSQKLALLLGRIDVAQKRYDAALADLAPDFEPAISMSAEPAAAALKVRSEALAGLGRYAESVRDLNQYLQLQETLHRRVGARQTAIMRAQVDADREAANADALRHQLAADQALNRAQLLGFVLAAAIALVIMLLLTVGLLLNRRHRQVLTRLAEEDALTGLPNRRKIVRLAEKALLETAAREKALCVAILDLDHFKSINDTFGHAAGDLALKAFAEEMRSTVGESGFVGRWGGEEFLVVLPRTTPAEAVELLAELRRRLEKIILDMMPDRRIGYSAGVAYGFDGPFDELCASADEALYTAKTTGRGKTCVAALRSDASHLPAERNFSKPAFSSAA